MADRETTRERFQAAGYGDVDLSSVDEPICFGSDAGDAYSFVSTFGITRGTADGVLLRRVGVARHGNQP